jgi:RNA polymerase sigma-70 factor (ECF subfamily)
MLSRLRAPGNESAWSTVVARFREPVMSFARKSGLSAQDSEDVAQDTLLAFANGVRTGGYDRGKGRLSKWLFGIAWNRVQKTRAAAQRGDTPIVHVDEERWREVPDEANAGRVWDELWERTLLDACLRQLRVEFRANTFRVFEMLVLEHRTPEDCERELSMSRNAVFIAKHRVMTRMNELVREVEDEQAP